MTDATLRARAQAWMDADPDPADRATVAGWLADDPGALAEAFSPRLAFGTAGLRGPIRPGPAGMNRLQVRQVTAGLLDWLHAQDVEGPLVIGYDGRRGSDAFARDAAGVARARGRAVFRFDTVVPTPVLAYAVRALGAAAGVMVTASHNPPDDNGYKVFWGDGAQIVPPHDKGIAGCVPDGAVEALADPGQPVPAEVVEAYVAEVLACRVHAATGPRIVYTPLHGVGRVLVERVLRAAGHTDLHVVPSQAEPDGTFPTVAFPNPEEPGALDHAHALADAVGADLVVANDPDADRLAVSVPVDGGWRRLTGNEIGWLLADDLLAHGDFPEPRGVATTLVSSTRLASIAATHGVRYAETLTGFKWLARVSKALSEAGGTLVLGYEEALGYSVAGIVRDKDGVSAALVLCDLAAHLAQQGRTLLDALEALDRRHGVLAGRQQARSHTGAEGQARIAAGMQTLRAEPPTALGGCAVRQVRDLLKGWEDLPPSNVLGYDLEGGHRALVRPSGTEPKLKIYVEARAALAGDDDLDAARTRAEALAEAIEADVVAMLERAGA